MSESFSSGEKWCNSLNLDYSNMAQIHWKHWLFWLSQGWKCTFNAFRYTQPSLSPQSSHSPASQRFRDPPLCVNFHEKIWIVFCFTITDYILQGIKAGGKCPNTQWKGNSRRECLRHPAVYQRGILGSAHWSVPARLDGSLWKLKECTPPVLSIAWQRNLGKNSGSPGE